MKKSLFTGWFGRLAAALIFCGLMCGAMCVVSYADELTADVALSTGTDSSALKDRSHSTTVTLNRDGYVTVKAADGSKISGLYIIWDSPVKPWTLTVDSGEISCGEHGFLHEYVSLNEASSQAVIHIPADGMRISDIRIFSAGELPADVQVWNPPCQKADIMMVAAHADDDILFFGGIIPTYGVAGKADIQVVYMTEFWTTAKIREHEKLDGLWADGLKNYPVSADFPDLYSKDVATAEGQYDSDKMVSFIAEQIRRFKPQVIVTHDKNGEYGHGFHMLTFKTVTAAVEAAADKDLYGESFSAYGVWNTPKTYIHLWGENKIKLDLRVPIEEMGGRTALEIAGDAYKQHVSQQWCWFYVSDDYEYSCAEFGLYRTTVGNDTGNNMLENIKTYREQAAEAESMSIAEAESMSKAEVESISKAEAESVSIAEAESISKAEAESVSKAEAENSGSKTVKIVAIVAAAAAAVGCAVFKIHLSNKRKTQRRKRD